MPSCDAHGVGSPDADHSIRSRLAERIHQPLHAALDMMQRIVNPEVVGTENIVHSKLKRNEIRCGAVIAFCKVCGNIQLCSAVSAGNKRPAPAERSPMPSPRIPHVPWNRCGTEPDGFQPSSAPDCPGLMEQRMYTFRKCGHIRNAVPDHQQGNSASFPRIRRSHHEPDGLAGRHPVIADDPEGQGMHADIVSGRVKLHFLPKLFPFGQSTSNT